MRLASKAQLDQLAILAAREDPTVFMQLVGRLEGGKRATAVPDIHKEWNQFFTENRAGIIFAAVGHGKSHLLRYRILWELGKNPNLRVAIIGAAKGAMPIKTLGLIKEMIEDQNPDAALKRVFPHLKPSVTTPMWTRTACTIERSDVSADPSIQTFGFEGKIHGSRIDLIIFDDFCDGDNTRTENMRDKAYEWVTRSVLSRFPPKGGRCWIIGNVWHEDDVPHRLIKNAKFPVLYHSAWKKDPVTEEDVPSTPEMWSKERLLEQEQIYGGADSPAAKMMLRNVLPSDSNRRIRLEWIQRCYVQGLEMQETWDPISAVTYSGVDLSIGSKRGDESCIFTIAVLPDGRRQIIDVRSGRWLGPQILQEINDVKARYGSIVSVEGGSQQDYILQFAQSQGVVDLHRHITSSTNKFHHMYGVESIGTELCQQKWMIPMSETGEIHPQIKKWIEQMLKYNPEEHVGDTLMASWICRECARLGGSGAGWTPDGRGGFIDPLTQFDSWYW